MELTSDYFHHLFWLVSLTFKGETTARTLCYQDESRSDFFKLWRDVEAEYEEGEGTDYPLVIVLPQICFGAA